MFDWLKSVFSARPRVPAPRAFEPPRAEPPFGRRTLVRDDVDKIETALTALENVGLRLYPVVREALRETAEDIADTWDGVQFAQEPGPGMWALIALSAESLVFENAIFHQDHCFDVMDLEGYVSMVANIVDLARDEWAVEGVAVTAKSTFGFGRPVVVTINGSPAIAPFELVHNKDFDWSIIARLNERLPATALGRFAIFHDGNATIVYLPPENIRQLNALCGYEFIYEERPAGVATRA